MNAGRTPSRGSASSRPRPEAEAAGSRSDIARTQALILMADAVPFDGCTIILKVEETASFKIRMSRCRHRFAAKSLSSEAPRRPGVYQLVRIGQDTTPEVLYVGAALKSGSRTIYHALASHMMGNIRPTAEDLARIAKDIYFEYVEEPSSPSEEDLKDIAGALVSLHKPKLNPSKIPSSGRYAAVSVEVAD